MYIRVNNEIFQGIPTFGKDILYVRIVSDDLTYGEVESMFSGETIEFLNDAQTDVTHKYWIRRIASISITNMEQRTFDVSLDVSSVGDGSVKGMQDDISDAGDALIELAEMIADHEERISSIESYNERITKNTEDITNVKPLVNDCIGQISTLNETLSSTARGIQQLIDRVAYLESVVQGGIIE